MKTLNPDLDFDGNTEEDLDKIGHIALEAERAEEAERLFEALSEGGDVEMPLEKTPWAEKHGSFSDRYGVQWMVSYTGDVELTLGDRELEA